jgi:DNA polymerase I
MKHLVLIDGYGFVFRAYHSLPPLTDGNGLEVGAVYGFTSMIMRLLGEVNATHMAIVLDSGSKNFRHDIYPDYKANRPPAPESLIPQFALIRDAGQAMGLRYIDKSGYEADDIIATIAKQASIQGYKVTIVSSDKDLMQLIDDNISMLDPIKMIPIDSEKTLAKFGVMPDKVRDILSLMGDKSDNIPGVPSIGAKTAAELINQFGSLEGVYKNIDQIKQVKRKEALIDNYDKAILSYELVGLKFDVETEITLDELRIKEVNDDNLLEFLNKYKFHSLISRIRKHKHNLNNHAKSYDIKIANIVNANQLKTWCDKSKDSAYVIITDISDKYIILGNDSNDSVYFIVSEEDSNLFNVASDKITINDCAKILREIFIDYSVKIIGCNLKPLINKLSININNFDDISLMSYLLNMNHKNYDISSMLNREFGEDNLDISEIIKLSNDKLEEQLIIYISGIKRLYDYFLNKLFTSHYFDLYHNIEKPLMQTLSMMEQNGILIDRSILTNLSINFKQQLSILEKEIFALCGCEFNLASPKQLGDVLYNKLSIAQRKGKSGVMGTGADILEELSAQGHVVADKILTWRQLAKLVSTYTDSLPKQINAKTARIHTHYLQTVTSTGRLSSNNPNLQNIPIRSDEGMKIRNAFIAPQGSVLLSADYSQIELRILAHVANIEPMQEAFFQNKDIHASTASQIFNIPIEQVDASHRRKAKAINFGIIYGISAFGLANQLKISRIEAASYIEAYLKTYSGIKQYMDDYIEYARKNGYVKTIFGRKCYVNNINDRNSNIRGFAERFAINAPMQGSAADIIKKAMIELDLQLKLKKSKAKILLQVHDELIIEVPESEYKEISVMTKDIMENITKLNVPLLVDIDYGKSWGECS